MPWDYLHGTKDYLGMATLLEEFPDIHQTFNLVPSLLLQLEEYARGDARDPSMDLAFKPVERLSMEDRDRIIERFFPVPIRTMLQPFPRYFELYERRSDPSRHHTFSDQDIRDIQVWWTLVWIDHDRRPKDLVEKGKDFSENDKARLRQIVIDTIQNIIPEYRRMQDQGTIEVSTSPFYHPILPILIDSRVDDGNVPLPVNFPSDPPNQFPGRRKSIRDPSGKFRQGLWPPEAPVPTVAALL